MIKEIREVGRVHDAPILVVEMDVASKEWVCLTYRANIGGLSLCFWSSRDDGHILPNALLDEIANDVAAALRVGAAEQVSEALFDIGYKQPPGWDRWGRPGVPAPMRSFFDEVLHPKLKTLVGA